MIMDEGLCNAEVIGGRGSLTCWQWLCEGLGPEQLVYIAITNTIVDKHKTKHFT